MQLAISDIDIYLYIEFIASVVISVDCCCCGQAVSNAVRCISDAAGESIGLKGSRMVLTGERGDDVRLLLLVVDCIVTSAKVV